MLSVGNFIPTVQLIPSREFYKMPSDYIHISDEIHGPPLLLGIMRRLSNSTSATLRELMREWAEGPMREKGLALATKLKMLQRVTLRVDHQIQRLKEQLNNNARINDCIQGGSAYSISDPNLPYDILVDIDSFLFESRSAYEIVGEFLNEFFRLILGYNITESQLVEMLDSRGIETGWIRALRDHRILFFHRTAPWIAVEVVSREPLEIELVILKKTVQELDNPEDYIKFEQLRSIYQGFIASLDATYQWLIEKIEEFEAGEEDNTNFGCEAD